MTSELLVCWIDPDDDRTSASDGQSRHGAYLRDHARLFDPFQDAPDGVTRNPVEFAMAAVQVAAGPIMWPGSSAGIPGCVATAPSLARMEAGWWCR